MLNLDQVGNNQVVVTDIKMPFWSMVSFMVKWAIATIPAMFILAASAFGLLAILMMLFGGTLAGLGAMMR